MPSPDSPNRKKPPNPPDREDEDWDEADPLQGYWQQLASAERDRAMHTLLLSLGVLALMALVVIGVVAAGFYALTRDKDILATALFTSILAFSTGLSSGFILGRSFGSRQNLSPDSPDEDDTQDNSK